MAQIADAATETEVVAGSVEITLNTMRQEGKQCVVSVNVNE